MFEIRLVDSGDEALLATIAPGVFDHPVDRQLAREFLADPRHHLAVAIDQRTIVAMASAVHYIHPDKRPELWVNEVGVAPAYRGQGLGNAVLSALFERGRALGCAAAWVLTERSNAAAMRLYSSLGGIESASDLAMFKFGLDADAGPSVTKNG